MDISWPYDSHPSGPPRAPTPCLGQESPVSIFKPVVPYGRKLGCASQMPALERGNFKGDKCVFWLWVLSVPVLFLVLEYAQVWIENEGNSIFTKKLSFYRAILNRFHMPAVHVCTASTGDASNPNPRECNSISPEEELPGHFWVDKGPPSYCQVLKISVSRGSILASQPQPRQTLHRAIFELIFFRIKSGV